MSKHSFIRGAAILGIAGVLVKVLGAILSDTVCADDRRDRNGVLYAGL